MRVVVARGIPQDRLDRPSPDFLAVVPWQGGFIANDMGHAWRSSDGSAWVPLGTAPLGQLTVGGVLVAVVGDLYWSGDGVTWTAVTGTTVPTYDWGPVNGGGGIAIALTLEDEMWITTDGRTRRDTGSKLIITETGEHGAVPSFCIGAGRLVTIISVGNLTRAYYADLLM
jgi:hypothetical protein